jgi:hypothetical protein
VALDDAMVVEGSGQAAVFRVMLSGPAPVQGVSVTYANVSIGAGSQVATAGVDFELKSETLTFAQGETLKTFSISIVNDDLVESDERFRYALSTPVNAVLSQAKSTGDGYILDDDTPGTRIAIERRTVFEGDVVEGASNVTDLVLRVLLSRPSASEITVNYATVNGTADTADFVPIPAIPAQTVTFAPGEMEQTVTVGIKGDNFVEQDEVFGVTLSNPSANATLATLAVQNINLLNDDGPGLLTAATLGPGADAAAPTAAQLNATLDAAISLWTGALGPNDPRLAQLDGLAIALTDFSGSALGATYGNTILIDADAAGHGWFADLTPYRNEEFRVRADAGILTATPRSAAFGRMDLLTAVMHEIGHVLGFTHEDAARYAVMHDALEAGTRYALGAPRFDFDQPWAGGTGSKIAWEDWGSDWVPAHKPRHGSAARSLAEFLIRR